MTCDSFKSYLSLNHQEKGHKKQWETDPSPNDRMEATRKSFYFQGASKYNKLPIDIRDTNSIVIFRNSVRAHLFDS